MFKRNKDIRQAKGDIPHWAIADKLGISENTWYRRLRHELDPTVKSEVLAAIDEINKELEKERENI